ncbi:cadmium-translocating P-type ATPase [Bacillus mangrovi]|uniref:Cd(2+)-exporting ATPase n=1 Tax=Metabacillus mangrovi TaxID=1491830 RepID=A0A7X2V4T0_9BACI|nr:heavy metal translocating P-type ATPase [Metabacillus mangrovi]MTH53414.1 cadmium-translocating P-type ATPase [Metabacillus mangrovi]
MNGEFSGEKMVYLVDRMDCPSCARSLEKGIGQMKDILDVKVNYSTAKMQVTAANEAALLPVENQVEKLGFKAQAVQGNTRTYHVTGMDCGSCAKSIENHLGLQPAVQKVSVSFASGKMKVEHTNSPGEIIKETAKIGFKAELEEAGENPVSGRKDHLWLILSGLLIAAGFAGTYFDIPAAFSILFYAGAMVISGLKPVKAAFYSIKSRSLDMNVLMSAAAIGAALIGEWLEGATVVWLFALGNVLQNKSIEQTRKSIRGLMDLAPPEAWVKIGTEFVKKAAAEAVPGTIILVKPGDKIPLDGEVVKGTSSINQAPITGESIPIDKAAGDSVFAGTINGHGTLEIKVTKHSEDTALAKIIHLVEEAQEQKAPTEAFIDKFAAIYTPIVFVLALLIMVLPPLLSLGTWGEWFYKGLELLVIACPCALVISTPVAIVSAIGNAARNGILIKGGTFLEKAGALTAIAFDKTGTLTEGRPAVTHVKAEEGTQDELLAIAYALEHDSTHPIAKSITEFARQRGAVRFTAENHRNIAGRGVQGEIDGMVYFAGNRALFEGKKVSIEAPDEEGETMIWIGTEEKILGSIAVSDTIRDSAAAAIRALAGKGIRETIMLTGDNEGTAKKIASEAHVTRYFAELLPEDKVTAVQKLQQEGHLTAMVGDGINDAPALAAADIGIAMGGAGTDTAMETADIVLMADNLDKLPHTISLSKKALRIIKQNIWFSILIKAAALALIFPGYLTLWMAVLSDTGAALIVILNALRLLKVKD